MYVSCLCVVSGYVTTWAQKISNFSDCYNKLQDKNGGTEEDKRSGIAGETEDSTQPDPSNTQR